MHREAEIDLLHMNFPSPIRKEVLLWEMMLLIQQMILLS